MNEEQTRPCPICGHEFTSIVYWHKKFCSLRCKRTAQKRRRRDYSTPTAQRKREVLADIEDFEGFKPRKSTRQQLLDEI